jgi:hypothetical protein
MRFKKMSDKQSLFEEEEFDQDSDPIDELGLDD